ncbi:MAG: ion channel [Parvularculaceae bacterium]
MTATASFHEEIIISAFMIFVTVFFHAVVISASASIFRATKMHFWGPVRFAYDAFILTIAGLVLSAAHGAEIWAWAQLFLKLNAFGDFETAFYFSSAAYTTLGFGDVLLPPEWRQLAGTIAADGLLLFGMSAAFLLETAARLRLGGERINHS